MQFARPNDIMVHYQTIGAHDGRAMMVFANSLGTDLRIWQDVASSLADTSASLLYDMRGHGLTEVGPTPYSIEMLGDDLAALMEHVGFRSAVVCGVSLGGVVAQQLHAARPDLVRGLVLCDTAAKIGDAQYWNARIAAIEAGGLDAIADGIIERWFSPAYMSRHPEAVTAYRNMLTRQPIDGYIAACAALAGADLSAHSRSIDVPTLCVVGDNDASTPPDLVAGLARSLPHSRLEILKECGHLPSIEQPKALAALLRTFLAHTGLEMASHVSH